MNQKRISVVVSTRNRAKAREIGEILGLARTPLTLSDLPDSPKIVEDGDSFEANARKKAVGLAKWLTGAPGRMVDDGGRLFVLADDSGLEVDALGGMPGIHSARFSAINGPGTENCSDAENNRKLLRLLEGVPAMNRAARFRCVLALTPVKSGGEGIRSEELDQSTNTFEGCCQGGIILAPRGDGGFGYDPLFVPEGRAETFAELGDSIKNTISHRAQALRRLATWLEENRIK